MPRFLIWPLLAAVMGFFLGGSVFWGLYGPNTLIEHVAAGTEQHGAKQESSSEGEKPDEALARYTFWLTSFTGLLALATFGLGLATIGLYITGEKQVALAKLTSIRQFRQTRESIALTRKSFTAVQRPFIYMDNIDSRPNPENDQQMMLWFPWRNAGSTAATNVETQINALFWPTFPLPAWFPFKDAAGVNRDAFFMAPGSTKQTGPLMLHEPELVRIASRQCVVYVYGWARYEDMMGLRHMTRFCAAIVGITQTGDKTSVVFRFNPTGNCADEQCEREAKEAKSKEPLNVDHILRETEKLVLDPRRRGIFQA